MIDPVLMAALRPLFRRQRRRDLLRRLATVWTLAGIVGIVGLGGGPWIGVPAFWARSVVAIIAVLGMGWAVWRFRQTRPDFRAIAGVVEVAHPELRGLLLTAVQQEMPAGRDLDFLPRRVVESAIDHGMTRDWRAGVPARDLSWAHAAHLAGLFLLLAVLVAPWGSVAERFRSSLAAEGLFVTPGDLTLEKGHNLVVLARFGRALPTAAELVVEADNEPPRRIPLVQSLSDPVFGGTVTDVRHHFRYRVESGSERSPEYKVTVFEFPRLERADAVLTFPPYTGLPPKRIEDTRRLSAVVDTHLDLTLQLNKPVTSARLIVRGAPTNRIDLIVVTNQARASLSNYSLIANQTLDLQLVDFDGRTNAVPASFFFAVSSNQTPEIRITSPRGDLRPSMLEEISYEGQVSDDFGVLSYGIAFTAADRETQIVELGGTVPGREKKSFQHVLRLEDLGLKPDQLVSWYVWADDLGPDGNRRRTTGDLFFAEIRPFDEIFREGAGMAGGEGGESDQAGGPATKLLELEKLILNATWKLRRGDGQAVDRQYHADAGVVLGSQAQALKQAQEAAEEATSARATTSWAAVIDAMTRAVDRLTAATNTRPPLAEALTHEQSALGALLQLQAREYEVSRSRNRSRSSGGSGESQNQRQIDQLDLAQSEDRYETQRQARANPKPEQREQLQILNRLQELARRQQDWNERVKELQYALQEARTEPEKEEIRRRLKRLQEEQQELLADTDELRQRMERPDNQSRMSAESRQLEETREDLQRAAESAGEGSTSQALAAGTRAQRKLQDLKEQVRKQNAGEFTEQLRELRSDSRELARGQEEVSQQMENLGRENRKSLSAASGQEKLLDRLGAQRTRMTNLVERATELSRQTESAEPLVSRHLEETLRKFTQEDGATAQRLEKELVDQGLLTRQIHDQLKAIPETDQAKSLGIATEMLRQGFTPQAGQAEKQARSIVDSFKGGIEKAAESVLGDDTEALRVAQQELETLTDELRRELEPTGNLSGKPSGKPSALADSSQPGAGSGQPLEPADGTDPSASSPKTGASAGSPGKPGQQPPGDPSPGAQAPGGSPNGNGTPQSGQARGERSAGQPGGQGRGARTARSGSDPESMARDVAANGGRGGSGNRGPLLGEEFGPWADRLRDVEEMLDEPGLRNDVATARESARRLRQDFRREKTKPDWAVVQLKVINPLVEVRSRIAEELARRGSREALVPIDRDPVPGRYTDLVRRYYEDLGKDRR
ncbi:MAG: hypothetical protein EXS36_03025 [Pedosphaera sp.]|nr:hypothetical protein [Pedosphaera sp.]